MLQKSHEKPNFIIDEKQPIVYGVFFTHSFAKTLLKLCRFLLSWINSP